MKQPDVYELHQDCILALRALIAEANRTCDLLRSVTGFPIDFQFWEKALQQRLAENAEYEKYQRARESLFQAIRPPKSH
jgi:hypothetical protein